ncbi:Sodium/bile acid cotransporter [Hondaea fermentalgiana]|uniref:Sodium/bile acid cotransporter n=1 Tax=Hondaea fermentalgiana TaxID=2315210 RepID=A0A2R5GJE6_9STRA|nr:Sodium/bile acid cotransporter [Hondaea fermentalgiana]|eukprot:GBG28783.1 Sodium/bile acid cotransporter [Hondaea fermentalgiana]
MGNVSGQARDAGSGARSWADVEAAQQAAAASQRHRMVNAAIRTANGGNIVRAGPSLRRAGGVRVGASLVPGSARLDAENRALIFDVRSDVRAHASVIFAPREQDEAPFFIPSADYEVAPPLTIVPGESCQRVNLPPTATTTNLDALARGVLIRIDQDDHEDCARAQCTMLSPDLSEKEQSIITRQGRLYKLKTVFGGESGEISQECVISARKTGGGLESGLLVDLHGGIASLGEYWASVEVGNTTVRLQVDTGSSSLVLASQSGYAGGDPVACDSDRCGLNTAGTWICRNGAENDTHCCAGLAPSYCGFYLEYGGDSDYHVTSEGVLAIDTLGIANQSFGEVVFYRALRETGPWPTRVDGILGLGLPRLNCNPTCSPPAYEAVLAAHAEETWGFGMCMGDSGGKMIFGSTGEDHRLFRGSLRSVPMLSTGLFGTYYSVGLTGISVGSEKVFSGSMAPPRQAIVDSGTTLLLLEEDLWQDLVQFFQGRYCRLPGICSEETIFEQGVCLTRPPQGFPTLSFDFAGVRLDLPPSMYFIQYKETAFCLGIQPAKDRTVLGDTFMRAYYTFFDLARRRVAFARPNRQVCGAVRSENLTSKGVHAAVHSHPGMLTSTSRATEAFQFSVGAIVGIAAILGQVFISCLALAWFLVLDGESHTVAAAHIARRQLASGLVPCTKATCVQETNAGNNDPVLLDLSCGDSGDTIEKVLDAVYGVLESDAAGCPSANGDDFVDSDVDFTVANESCAAESDAVKTFVAAHCLGKETCTLDLLDAAFNFTGCSGQARSFAVHVQCSTPFDFFQIAISAVIVLIGVGMGAAIELDVLRAVINEHRFALILGVMAQFGFMPLISYIFTLVLDVDPYVAVGMIIVGSSPGGVTSNLMTYWAKGSTALSMTMSAFSTACALFMMPLLIYLYVDSALGFDGIVQIPFLSIFTTLLLVLLPGAFGVIVRAKRPVAADYLERFGSILGAIFIAIALVLGVLEDKALFSSAYGDLWIAASLLQPLGSLLGYASATFAQLPRPERRAVCLEVGVQNTTLAISVIVLSFSDRTCTLNNVLPYGLIATFMYLVNSIIITLFLRFVVAPRDPSPSQVQVDDSKLTY